MNRTLKVFFACAFGAGIGAMIALQIGGYLWWIGMLVGGLVGYISYEFKAVIRAIVYAWNEIVIDLRSPESIKTLKALFWGVIFISGAFASGFAIMALMTQKITVEQTDQVALRLNHLIITLYLMSVLLYVFFYALNSLVKGGHSNELLSKDKAFLLSLSPILFFTFWQVAFPFFVAKHLVRAVGAFFKVLPAIGRFFKTVFVQIHSDERLLCFFDAGIGAAIGYFAGNALIGAIAGGILGVLNYEIVTKRWLKLAPAKS